MKYDKLVRDKIPEIIANDGKKAVTRILNDDEYKIYLEKKLDEEVAEFHESKSIEELADIFEVVCALADVYADVLSLVGKKISKNNERGNFDKRICLVEVEE